MRRRCTLCQRVDNSFGAQKRAVLHELHEGESRRERDQQRRGHASAGARMPFLCPLPLPLPERETQQQREPQQRRRATAGQILLPEHPPHPASHCRRRSSWPSFSSAPPLPQASFSSAPPLHQAPGAAGADLGLACGAAAAPALLLLRGLLLLYAAPAAPAGEQSVREQGGLLLALRQAPPHRAPRFSNWWPRWCVGTFRKTEWHSGSTGLEKMRPSVSDTDRTCRQRNRCNAKSPQPRKPLWKRWCWQLLLSALVPPCGRGAFA